MTAIAARWRWTSALNAVQAGHWSTWRRICVRRSAPPRSTESCENGCVKVVRFPFSISRFDVDIW